jgi:5-methylcytosine-specific restriction enzyme A
MAERDTLDRLRRIHSMSGNVPKDAQGRPFCRWCGKPVPPPRRTVCSEACVHEILMRTRPSYARAQVEQRDRGVCSACGIDTQQLVRISRRLESLALYEHRAPASAKAPGGWAPHPAAAWRRVCLQAFLATLNLWAGHEVADLGDSRWNRGPHLWRHLWEADHTVPVVEGGGGAGLDEYRTLCIPCHKLESRKLAGRLARRRRRQLSLLPEDQDHES